MQKIMKNISAFLTLFSQGFLLNASNELNQLSESQLSRHYC